MKFAPNLDQKVDMEKVNLDTVKPWVVNRITSLLGFEDDVVTEFIFNLLENEKVRIVHMSVCTRIELIASGSVLTAEYVSLPLLSLAFDKTTLCLHLLHTSLRN